MGAASGILRTVMLMMSVSDVVGAVHQMVVEGERQANGNLVPVIEMMKAVEVQEDPVLVLVFYLVMLPEVVFSLVIVATMASAHCKN